MLALITMCLRGMPFIYQGQEIGRENMEFSSVEGIDDISTKDEYQVALRAGLDEKEALRVVNRFSRDNARTPMQWTADEKAGFTTGTPWLVVNPKCKQINVETQVKKEDSVFSFYRKLIALRKNPEYKNVMVYGTFRSYAVPEKNLMVYSREDDEKRLLVAANYQSMPQSVTLPSTVTRVLLTNDDEIQIEGTELQLSGYQAIVFEI